MKMTIFEKFSEKQDEHQQKLSEQANRILPMISSTAAANLPVGRRAVNGANKTRQ